MTSVLLLSGGASTRMGRDKAQLLWQGRSLLEYQVQRYETAGFHVVHGLADIHSGFKGPLAGIHSALHHYPDIQNWIVIPVDMPQLSIEAIQRLVFAGKEQSAHVAFEDCPLPVFIRAETSTTELLNEWLSDENGKRSVYALLNATHSYWIEPNQFKEELVNINTPEQWKAFSKEAV